MVHFKWFFDFSGEKGSDAGCHEIRFSFCCYLRKSLHSMLLLQIETFTLPEFERDSSFPYVQDFLPKRRPKWIGCRTLKRFGLLVIQRMGRPTMVCIWIIDEQTAISRRTHSGVQIGSRLIYNDVGVARRGCVIADVGCCRLVHFGNYQRDLRFVHCASVGGTNSKNRTTVVP